MTHEGRTAAELQGHCRDSAGPDGLSALPYHKNSGDSDDEGGRHLPPSHAHAHLACNPPTGLEKPMYL